MSVVMPWAEQVSLIEPQATAPGAIGGRLLFAVQTVFCMYLLQQWLNLSDSATKETLYDTSIFRDSLGMASGNGHLSDESTMLPFGRNSVQHHVLAAHDPSKQMFATVNVALTAKGLLLQQDSLIEAMLIAVVSLTKSVKRTRDPLLYQASKGRHWHDGMMAHVGAKTESGLMQTVVTKVANAHDITLTHAIVHDQEFDVSVDLSYWGVESREEVQSEHANVSWDVVTMQCKRQVLDKSTPLGAVWDHLEKTNANIHARVEHAFRVTKLQFRRSRGGKSTRNRPSTTM